MLSEYLSNALLVVGHDVQRGAIVVLGIAFLVLTICLCCRLHYSALYDDGLPVVNRKFSFEPRVFARIRWACGSMQILDEAQEKYGGAPYRLARGDTDLTVLPTDFVQELNRLPEDVISSRDSHAASLLGHLNGMNVVTRTNRHVSLLLNRITPALSDLLPEIHKRVNETFYQEFPRTNDWREVFPVESVVLCISRGVALVLFGQPICDNPELYSVLSKHTQNVFGVGFLMRIVPAFLQPYLVWALPTKWHLEQTWQTIRRYVYPLVRQRSNEHAAGKPPSMDLISCMVSDQKHQENTDPELLAGLMGSTSSGATYSTTSFIVGVLSDLVAHPIFLEEIRKEIQEIGEDVRGEWDLNAYNRLDKLDSAMKESARCLPPTLVNYARLVVQEHTLSNGLTLKKGQRICVSGRSRVTDPVWFEQPESYNALRAYNKNLQEHQNRPFSSSLSDDFRWGAGRWACPGRGVATVMAKILLVKLLGEYDIRFIKGQPPPRSQLHEFLFFQPNVKLELRARRTG